MSSKSASPLDLETTWSTTIIHMVQGGPGNHMEQETTTKQSPFDLSEALLFVLKSQFHKRVNELEDAQPCQFPTAELCELVF